VAWLEAAPDVGLGDRVHSLASTLRRSLTAAGSPYYAQLTVQDFNDPGNVVPVPVTLYGPRRCSRSSRPRRRSSTFTPSRRAPAASQLLRLFNAMTIPPRRIQLVRRGQRALLHLEGDSGSRRDHQSNIASLPAVGVHEAAIAVSDPAAANSPLLFSDPVTVLPASTYIITARPSELMFAHGERRADLRANGRPGRRGDGALNWSSSRSRRG